MSADPFFDTKRDRIVTWASERRLPAVYHFRDYAVAGGTYDYHHRGEATMMTYQFAYTLAPSFSSQGEATLEPSGRRWSKRCMLIAAVFVILGTASVVLVWPAVAAYVCPSCYGLERVTGSLFVEPAMSVEDRRTLQETVARAVAQVASFYGSFDRQPILLACASGDCDRKLGGRGNTSEYVWHLIHPALSA